MQETRVQSLIQEDYTYHRTAGPIRHDYWALTLQSPYATTVETHAPRTCAPKQDTPVQWGKKTNKQTKNQQISEMCRVWAACGGSHCKFLARGSRKMSCLEKTFGVVGALYLSVVCFPAASVIGDLVRCRLLSPVSDPLNQIPKWLACMLKFGNIGVKEAEGNPEGYWSTFGVKY